MDSERTIDATTIFNRWMWGVSLVVALIAEVCRPKAMEKGNWAAEVAFPIDLLSSMFRTLFDSGSVNLHLTWPALQVLFPCLIFHVKLALAIDQTTKVWFVAVEALIKRASMHGCFKKLRITKFGIAGGPFVRDFQSLFFGNLESLFLNLTSQVFDLSELFLDLGAIRANRNIALAARASHKRKIDFERIPAMLQ